ncbi:hypothetical protein A3K92_05810 [Thermococcus gorgonarius]|uniref:Uncharacterized protein n=2 Tax=Thermococcus gorgonarius TaxID=71997 RepID=A0A2Z2M702_THEGO|nr:hypothetical protein A3K92_05810 [Thermococcus gorgonarius]
MLVAVLAGWILGLLGSIWVLCKLFWYYAPRSNSPVVCRRARGNELLKNTIWGLLLKLNSKMGIIGEIILLLFIYEASVFLSAKLFEYVAIGISGVVRHFNLSSLVLIVLLIFLTGIFLGFLTSWVLLLFISGGIFTKKNVFSSVLTILIAILPSLRFEKIYSFVSHSIDEVGTILKTITSNQGSSIVNLISVGTVKGVYILFLFGMVLVVLVGYKFGRTRNRLLPHQFNTLTFIEKRSDDKSREEKSKRCNTLDQG